MPKTKIFPKLSPTAIALLFIAAVMLLPFLGMTDFNTKGEPREAIVAQTMLQTDNWVLPSNNGGEFAYKPPLFHWLVALSSLPGGEVTEFTSQGPDILAFAWPSAIESGKRYAVTVTRTDLNGVTRTSSAKTVAVTGSAPAPTVERGYSEGMSAEEAGWVYPERGFILEGSNLSGASVNVAYRTLDGREGNYDVPAASVTATAGSVTVSESGLSTLFSDAEAGSTVTFTVTTAGGTATYNGEVQAPA